MRLVTLALAVAICGCVTPAATNDPPLVQASAAERHLRALIGTTPRGGDLVVGEDTLYLRIRQGARSRPFMAVPRGTFKLACEETSGTLGGPSHHDVWWLFTGAEAAVALQLSTFESVLWFWDEARDCPVSVKTLVRDTYETTPPRYYKAADAQVAYRWNHGFTPLGALYQTPDGEVDGVISGGESDFIRAIPGTEMLVVERDFVGIRSADGRVLLQKELDIEPDWPCYRSEITVFEEATGGLYAIASLETFGTFTDCTVGGDNRFELDIFDWDPNEQVFVPSFATVDQHRVMPPNGERVTKALWRTIGVDGGVLRIERESANHHTSEEVDDCWRSVTASERETTYTLIATDGAALDLGTAGSAARERVNDCGSP